MRGCIVAERHSTRALENTPMSHGFVACMSLPLSTCMLAAAARAADLRPPAVPLVACDPYFSIWSPADRLTDADTVHWTGKPHRLRGLVRVDGQLFRFLGGDDSVPALPQTAVQVLPTRTIYQFDGAGIRLTLTWLTPALPDDIDILSRPVTYLTADVTAADGGNHRVQLHIDASGELAVDRPAQTVLASVVPMDGLTAVRIGSETQNILARRGDDIRIDWGHFYLAAPTDALSSHGIGTPTEVRDAFAAQPAAKSGSAVSNPSTSMPSISARPSLTYSQSRSCLIISFGSFLSLFTLAR